MPLSLLNVIYCTVFLKTFLFTISGGEFCEGYTNEEGVYHSGFQCPLSWEDGSETEEVYCCGTATLKFCCDEPTNGFDSKE